MIGIYKITNPKGRVYIGQSIDIATRFSSYKGKHCKKQIRLYNSLVKYGHESHDFEIILECEVEELNALERGFQELYDVLSKKGMNCTYQGFGDRTGERSQETKDKISIKNKGAKNGMYGRRLSKEQKEARIGLFQHTEEAKIRIGEASFRGKNPNAKLVIDLNTGIYYNCAGDAADSLGIAATCIRQWLNGKRPNKSNYAYA